MGFRREEDDDDDDDDVSRVPISSKPFRFFGCLVFWLESRGRLVGNDLIKDLATKETISYKQDCE